jgi:hypothetical protein
MNIYQPQDDSTIYVLPCQHVTYPLPPIKMLKIWNINGIKRNILTETDLLEITPLGYKPEESPIEKSLNRTILYPIANPNSKFCYGVSNRSSGSLRWQ